MMTPQIILLAIVVILIAEYLLESYLSFLNLRTWKKELPSELRSFYNREQYVRGHKYHREQYNLELISDFVGISVTLIFLGSGGFAYLDEMARSFTNSTILQALIFFAVLAVLGDLLQLPFTLYGTFRIEEKYGFNRTNLKTFFQDKLKNYGIGALIGGLLLSIVIFFYQTAGDHSWIISWGVVSLVVILINIFYTSWILPFFNKLSVLQDNDLRYAIDQYARKVDFPLASILVMDGSRRSSRGNAFFSGLGKEKKIVFFDTLLEKHSIPETIAILAHETGHYKKKHIFWNIAVALLQLGVTLYLLFAFMGTPELSLAMGAKSGALHLGMVGFFLLYSPVNMVLSVITGALSRKHEFEADRFAAETSGASDLISALGRLSVDHLSNLHPHPYYVFFHYSHPPVIRRIERLSEYATL